MRTLKDEMRSVFDRAITDHLAKGDADAVARAELLREWFCNDAFREGLADELWRQANAPTMTDMMVDSDSLDAFMAANPLPD